jgi:hypothetical protein
LIELNSSPDFDANIVQKLTSEDTRLQFAHKRYTNQDFHDFKKVTLEDDLSDDDDIDGLNEDIDKDDPKAASKPKKNTAKIASKNEKQNT